jgi:hypothetical protein
MRNYITPALTGCGITCCSGLDKADIKGQLSRMNGQKGKEVWESLGLEKRVDLDHLRRVFDRLDTKGVEVNFLLSIVSLVCSIAARTAHACIPVSDFRPCRKRLC